MKRSQKTFNVFQLASAVFMIAALLWLTISAPFVYAGQQQLTKQEQTTDNSLPQATNEEEAANPFGNNTEEKAGSSSFSEEYLHDHHKAEYFFSIVLRFHTHENVGTYIAFHGELHVPPPNVA
jgi:hypothetical protein